MKTLIEQLPLRQKKLTEVVFLKDEQAPCDKTWTHTIYQLVMGESRKKKEKRENGEQEEREKEQTEFKERIQEDLFNTQMH